MSQQLILDGKAYTPDLCGFLMEPALSPLCYSSGQPVMRGDVELMFHEDPCAYWSKAAGKIIRIAAFDPKAHTDTQLAKIAIEGAPGVTDLASIPGFARWAFPPNGRYLKPALKHDEAFETFGYGGLITFDQANAELLADMKAVGCGLAQRQIIYRSVEWFGRSGWGR